jgi:hypothetical protein
MRRISRQPCGETRLRGERLTALGGESAPGVESASGWSGCGTRRSLVAGKVWQARGSAHAPAWEGEGRSFHGWGGTIPRSASDEVLSLSLPPPVKCGIPQTVDFDLSSVLDVRSPHGFLRTFPKEEACLRLRVPTRKHGSVRGAFVPAVPGRVSLRASGRCA